MREFFSKWFRPKKYNPREFISKYIFLFVVFSIVISGIIIYNSFLQHRLLVRNEKQEELDLIISALSNSENELLRENFHPLEKWVKKHSEVRKVSLYKKDGSLLDEFTNTKTKTSNLIIEKNLKVTGIGFVHIKEYVDVSPHDRHILFIGLKMFASSIFILLFLGYILYKTILNFAIDPLQQEALKESLINMTIIENLQMGISLLDKELNLIKANHLIKNWYGSFSLENYGQKCYSCLNPNSNSECLNCPVIQTLNDGQRHETIRSVIHNGEIRYERLQSFPVMIGNDFKEVIEIVEDITQRVKEEDKFRRTHRAQQILSLCIQSLFHSTSEQTLFNSICQIIADSGVYNLVWVALYNPDHKKINAVAWAGYNSGFLQNLTFANGEPAGSINPVTNTLETNSLTVIHDIDSEPLNRQWKEIAQENGFNSMMSLPLRNGQETIGTLNLFAEQKYIFNDEETALMLRLADEISFGIKSFRTEDVSKNLLEINKNLQERKDEAEIANRKKDDFLALITHEIRTPLTGILGITELLLNNPVSKEQRNYLNIIKSSADLQLLIINDILDLSKIENGKLLIDKSLFNPYVLINEVTQSFSWQFQEKKLKLLLEVAPDIPQLLLGDPLRIKQILFNLIGNAVKFTEKGGVKILAETMYQDSALCNLRFTVIDSGIGIPLEKQSGIFESYVQADISISKKYGGTGLGTTISKRLVELMGGFIGLKSPARNIEEFNQPDSTGSEFWFNLELAIPGAGDVPEQKTSKKRAGISFPKKCKILVAEDNEVNQLLIRIMLEKMNQEVDIAGDGSIAIEMANEKHYDLIFMDVEMPRLDGKKAALVLRNEKKVNTPIIALTANKFTANLKEYKKTGFNDILCKPYKQNDLQNILNKWLKAANG